MNIKLPRFNLTVKLVLFLLWVSVLPLLVVGWASYNTARSVIQEEVSGYTLGSLIEQKNYLELLVDTVDNLIANVSSVEGIKTVLDDQGKAADTYTRLTTHAQIGYILNNYINLKGLVSIDIFTLGGAHYHVGDTLDVRDINQPLLDHLWEEAKSSDKLVLWAGVEDNVNLKSAYPKVVTAMKLFTVVGEGETQQKPIALLLVNYNIDNLYNHFNELKLGEGAYMVIVDNEERLVYHPDKSFIGSKLASEFLAQLDQDQGSFTREIEGQEMLVSYTKAKFNNWFFISFVPVTTLTARANNIWNMAVGVMAICFVFIGLGALAVSRTMVSPLNHITDLFKQIEAGTYNGQTRFKMGRQDEIGDLLQWFNTFLDSLEAKQRAEVALMQAKDAAEAANQKVTELNQLLEGDNLRLEATLQELLLTQQELVQSEKMAALGQLVAGVAHEINTPLGAIQASLSNNVSSLRNLLTQLPRLFQTLSIEEQHEFFALVDQGMQTKRGQISIKEARQVKRTLRQKLESEGVVEADTFAEMLVEMGIYEDLTPFWPLLKSPHGGFTLQVAYDLISIRKDNENMGVAVERASKVVFALKSYARYDHSGAKQLAQVTDGLETILTLYHNQLKHGVEVIRHYGDVPPLACYADELNQVWTNLIHNAIQAMAHQGKLEIAVYLKNGYIVVDITDSGQGIPPEIKDRIFEPFFTTKGAGEGSGLGLDIVRKIVAKHEGQIEVASQPGRTTFSVMLPQNQSI